MNQGKTIILIWRFPHRGNPSAEGAKTTWICGALTRQACASSPSAEAAFRLSKAACLASTQRPRGQRGACLPAVFGRMAGVSAPEAQATGAESYPDAATDPGQPGVGDGLHR